MIDNDTPRGDPPVPDDDALPEALADSHEAQEPQADPDTDPAGDPAGDAREAAKWRHRLRDTEAERDALAGKVEALQRAEITRLAGERLHRGEDLWKHSDVTVADLLNDAGVVDPAKVQAALDTLKQDAAYLFDSGWGASTANGGGVGAWREDGAASWSGLLRGR